MYSRADRWTNRHTDGHADGWTTRQTDGWTVRWMDKIYWQINKQTNT